MWVKISEKKGGWLDKDCRDKGESYFSHGVRPGTTVKRVDSSGERYCTILSRGVKQINVSFYSK